VLTISSSEADRNSYQRGADGDHCKTRCPGPKPGMSRKREPAKNNDTTAIAVEIRSAN